TRMDSTTPQLVHVVGADEPAGGGEPPDRGVTVSGGGVGSTSFAARGAFAPGRWSPVSLRGADWSKETLLPDSAFGSHPIIVAMPVALKTITAIAAITSMG